MTIITNYLDKIKAKMQLADAKLVELKADVAIKLKEEKTELEEVINKIDQSDKPTDELNRKLESAWKKFEKKWNDLIS